MRSAGEEGIIQCMFEKLCSKRSMLSCTMIMVLAIETIVIVIVPLVAIV